MIRIRIAACLALGLLAGACTTAIESGVPTSQISRGYSYQLPRIAYDAEIKRTLVHCPVNASDKVRFDIAATAASRITPGETIVVNYLTMGDGLKTTDLGMSNHPTGMLKTINLTVNDHTADFVKEGVKSVVGIGKIVIGLPGAGAVAAGGKNDAVEPYLRCKDDTDKMLQSLPELKAKVKAAEAAAKTADKALEDLLSSATAGKPPPAADLAALKLKAREAAAAVDKAKEAQSKGLASLVVIDRISLEVDDAGSQLPSDLKDAVDGEVDPADLLELYYPDGKGRHIVVPLTRDLAPDIDRATPVGYKTPADAKAGLGRLKGAIDPFVPALAQLGLAKAVVVATPIGAKPPARPLPDAEGCTTGAKDCGIVYRAPAPGRVRVCGVGDDSSIDPATCVARLATTKGVLFQEDRLVPQFGRLVSLPMKNGPFSNNTLSAEFTEDGRIVQLTYKKPVAEGVAALASVNEGIGGVSQLIAYEKGKELRALQEQKTYNDALLAKNESENKLTPSEVEAIKKQTDVVNAQIALATAQQSALLQTQPSQVTQVTNETSLYDAQLKRVQKLVELRKAEQELEALTPKDEDDEASE